MAILNLFECRQLNDAFYMLILSTFSKRFEEKSRLKTEKKLLDKISGMTFEVCSLQASGVSSVG